MFIEPRIGKAAAGKFGWIEVICGCMFSGKTEELIRRLKRALIAGQRVEIFKPRIDSRHQMEAIVSHDENTIRSTSVRTPEELLLFAGNSHVVGVDEAQFFDQGIVEVCNALANSGKRVIIAGLDMDFEGNPFGPMPHLLAVAEYVTKLHAVCMKTGELASFSYRLTGDNQQVVVGDGREYEARSRGAFYEGMAQRNKE